MITIKSIYKESNGHIIKDMSLKISNGEIVSIECSNDISDILFNIILCNTTLAKGEVLFNDLNNNDYIKKNIKNIGVILRDDSFYENLTIESYLKFFSKLINSKKDINSIMLKLGLYDIGSKRIKDLSTQQKKRLSFARELLKELKILIIQEPILNTDNDTKKIILDNIQGLSDVGVSILCTSVSYKDVLQVGDRAFSLNSGYIKEITKDDSQISNDQKQIQHNYEKIPVKIDDKILLFNPHEINYIETKHGVSSLNVQGEEFPCTISLTELESRLKRFGFFRCHRSYLVNLNNIREVVTWTRNSYSLVLDDKIKSSIPLSKGRVDELKQILNL